MIVFLSCVAEKNDHRCAAKDLYISPLFQKSYAYAQQLNPDHIYILSAKYYLLELDDVISPYNLTLKDMDAESKRIWADKVVEKMKEKSIDFNEDVVFLTGTVYYQYLLDYFPNHSPPFAEAELGGIGYILQWLDQQIGFEAASRIDEQFNKINKEIKMSKINRLKLAKLLLKFAEVETDKGLLTYEGELVVGNEVFIEKDGELIPAEDGEYVAEDKTIVVKDGKIAEIVMKEDEQPVPIEGEDVENPTDNTIKEDEKEVKIAELEAVIAEKDKEIESLKAEIEEMKTKLQMSTDKSPKEKMKEIEDAIKQNPALKYFTNCK